MDSKDKLLILAFILLIVTVAFTLVNIQKFMKVEKTCEDDFAIINKCGCIPDGVDYFFVPNYIKKNQTLYNGK